MSVIFAEGNSDVDIWWRSQMEKSEQELAEFVTTQFEVRYLIVLQKKIAKVTLSGSDRCFVRPMPGAEVYACIPCDRRC